MPTQQTLFQRFLAHMAGINVGLHVEKKYNTHFDCFDFFNAKIVCVLEKMLRMWLFDSPKRGTVRLIYVIF